ncbi:hypothetical protein GQ651_17570 [Alphaproteobacteria bacterium GH1-50]|uniref:Uncharacterized protein n=1 Tax=Kangsaoukella pontilimi TaxID=2691042 RepID=A0A7C9MSW0_9RHOB|nr:hypothetical protein [Kangsaoukella pontilimi]MXQ09657.1 hypothetical protein [Kangsaoukella pontilimi]
MIGVVAAGALRRGFPLGWPVIAALMTLPWVPLLYPSVWMGPWHPALPDVLLALTVAALGILAVLEWGLRRLGRRTA